MRRLLIIEDNALFAKSLLTSLEDQFSVEVCHSFSEATKLLHLKPYDIVLCDYILNGTSGLEVVAHISTLVSVPRVVMMTAFAEKSMAIKALNSGVCHLLEKPFQVKELRAVLHSLDKKNEASDSSIKLCPATNSVFWQGRKIQLTPTEYLILSFMIAQQNSWVSRDQIEEMLWQENPHLSRNILDTHIYNLRKKVPDLKDHLSVMRGKGFLLKSIE